MVYPACSMVKDTGGSLSHKVAILDFPPQRMMLDLRVESRANQLQSVKVCSLLVLVVLCG